MTAPLVNEKSVCICQSTAVAVRRLELY